LDVGDRFPSHAGISDFLFGPESRAISTAYALLRLLPEEKRLEIVVSALEQPVAGIKITTTMLLSQVQGSKRMASKDALFTEQDGVVVQALVSGLIQEALNSDRLLEHPRAGYLLHQWMGIAPADARKAIREHFERDDVGFLKLLNVFTNVVTSESPTPVPLDTRLLHRLFDIIEIENRLKAIANSQDPAMATEAEQLYSLLEQVRVSEIEADFLKNEDEE
jgi:hypothetical protein